MPESLHSTARRFIEERRRGLEAPAAIDAHALAFARRVAARQLRGDSTLPELPLLSAPVAADLIPIYHNGSTYGVAVSSLQSVPAASYVFANGVGVYSGAGVPTLVAAKGSMFLRSDGGIGSTLYVTQGAGVWNAVGLV